MNIGESTHTHTCTHTHTHTCAHGHIHTCMSMCVHAHTPTHEHTYMLTSTGMHAYTQAHTLWHTHACNYSHNSQINSLIHVHFETHGRLCFSWAIQYPGGSYIINDYWRDVAIVSSILSKDKFVSWHRKVFCILYSVLFQTKGWPLTATEGSGVWLLVWPVPWRDC